MFSSTSQNLLLILSSNKKEGGRCVLIAVIYTSVKIPACKLYYSSCRDHLSPSLSLVLALSLAFSDSFSLLLLSLLSIITFSKSNLIWQPICYTSTLRLVTFVWRLCLKFQRGTRRDTVLTRAERKIPPSPRICAPDFRRSTRWRKAGLMACGGVGRSVRVVSSSHFWVARESGKVIHYQERSEVVLSPALNSVLLFGGGWNCCWRPVSLLQQSPCRQLWAFWHGVWLPLALDDLHGASLKLCWGFATFVSFCMIMASAKCSIS